MIASFAFYVLIHFAFKFVLFCTLFNNLVLTFPIVSHVCFIVLAHNCYPRFMLRIHIFFPFLNFLSYIYASFWFDFLRGLY
jgi:hypothetical protein